MNIRAFGHPSMQLLLSAGMVLLLFAPTVRAEPPMSWNLRHPTVPAHHLHQLIEADDALIAVGDLGTIFKSRDGLNWTVSFHDSAERINAAAFGGGKHIAFGDRGSWWTSVNADSWTR